MGGYGGFVKLPVTEYNTLGFRRYVRRSESGL